MNNRSIISPMATGSGAHVIHSLLGTLIPGYQISSYHPYWTLFPFALPQIVSTRSADLIHTSPDHARFFYRKSIPLVITFHGYVLDGQMRPYCSWLTNTYHLMALRFWIRSAIKMAHTVTAVSRFTAHLVQQDLNISRSVNVIYNGIDVHHFRPKNSSRSDTKEIRVLFSGNLTRRKGAHWLPLIAKLLQKNNRIFYTQVVAEAMACGLPVVASNCSAIPELIDEGKGGFLCPVGDVKAFAEKINLLADSPKLRREMGEYNRAKVEKMFTLDRMIKEYQDLFQEVLG